MGLPAPGRWSNSPLSIASRICLSTGSNATRSANGSTGSAGSSLSVGIGQRLSMRPARGGEPVVLPCLFVVTVFEGVEAGRDVRRGLADRQLGPGVQRGGAPLFQHPYGAPPPPKSIPASGVGRNVPRRCGFRVGSPRG